MLFVMPLLRQLFAKKQLGIFLLAIIPLALFFVMRAKLSWRPRILGKMKGEVTALTWSPDGKWLGALGRCNSLENAVPVIYVIANSW